jgi:hypothetical protein
VPSCATTSGCGKLEKPAETTGALLHIPPARTSQYAFVDPLCDRGHQRLRRRASTLI